MARRKLLLSLIFILVSVVLFTLYWAYHHKILSGDFDKLTIHGMKGETIQVLKDRNEIAKIISDINESPRNFKFDNGLTYDYLPHGIMTFENKTKKVQIGVILTNGNTVTKYWEIDTEFPFGNTSE
ncbi:hypothetical protein LC048_02165 [Mesobacillus subterraneus]|uniref:hypothetical protein n=1 Tax=Mesobacillus subterraneus TaxID=285983 RepID=UPI001CFC4D20|nr:hypothetical protein [Mesobacillus subterraneus]WLR55834.1 hypothetical protein LC048_02165 [Mesobacillus subterraneus]